MHLAARPTCAVKGAERRSSKRSGDPLQRGVDLAQGSPGDTRITEFVVRCVPGGRQAGVQDAWLHKFRANFATTLLRNGVTLPVARAVVYLGLKLHSFS